MTLNYALYENNLKSAKPNSYVAKPLVDVTKTLDEVLNETTEHGSTVTKAEALAFFEELITVILKALLQGFAINTPLFNMSFSISGNFNGPDDTFDPARHSINITITPGLRVKEIISKINLSKVTVTKPKPVVTDFFDHSSQNHNDTVTKGGIGKLTGVKLQIDEKDEQQGIFFIPLLGGTIYKSTGFLVKNDPSELIFTIPADLIPGEYNIEVRAKISEGKELRKGSFEKTLTVA
jgi:hypothetical protein